MSSLYSQPLTRRSTATDESSPVHTPFDDINIVPPREHEHGRKASRFGAGDAVEIRSPSDTASSGSRSAFRRMRDGEDGAGVDVGRLAVSEADADSYFSRPSQRSGGTALARRGTTKELIGRFEAMGGSVSSTGSSSGTSGRTARGGPTPAVRAGKNAEKKEKARLPIRESFRNLLSVFKKSKPLFKDQSEPRSDMSSRGVSPKREAYVGTETPRKPGSMGLSLQIPEPTKDARPVCISPVSAHTGKAGALLYLSRIPASDLPPVWMHCAAQLHSTHVLVMWNTPQGNPAPRLVSFAACTDVRSLAPADLDPAERALLPADAEWRVFELLFEGRAREKFAADSLTERATWVSAIWDAVLQVQDNRVYSPAEPEGMYPSSQTALPVSSVTLTAEPRSDKRNLFSPSRSSRMSAADVDRDLPPVPTDASKPPILPRLDLRNLSLSASTLSPLPAPPTTPQSGRRSFLAPPRTDSPSRAPSPSIRDLDERSVVKQRLAQIETRPQSPMSPTARRLQLAGDDRLSMRREGSAGSSVATSILNSYLGPDPESPRSAGVGGLAAALPPPPQMSRVNDDRNERINCISGPPKHEAMFSPASRYSEEDRGENEMQNLKTSASTAYRPPTGPPILPSSSPTVHAVAVESTVRPVLDDIQRGIDVLQGRSATTGTNIVNIRTKVDEVLEELRRRPRSLHGDDTPGSAAVIGKLDVVQADIKDHMSGLRALVEELRKTEGARGNAASPQDLTGLAELHEKLDDLVKLAQETRGTPGDSTKAAATEGQDPPSTLAEVLSLLKDAETERATQMEQQTDSIRYLNELNTWLEAFVKHGTSQIEGVAAGIQQLCGDLGPISELQDQPESSGEDASPATGSLLSDIRRLLVHNKEREQNAADLHASVNGLVAAVQEDLRRNAEARNLLTTESVVGMIDRQRQDQERMLKALATELSNDIRGERLRFVEAMKEATAINVQIHVEEFKKELTREVLLMTQEVTRLQRERQELEQQIADLFAFYAKQKQAGKVIRNARTPVRSAPMAQPALTVLPGAISSSQSIHRRPLPSPVPSPMRVR